MMKSSGNANRRWSRLIYIVVVLALVSGIIGYIVWTDGEANADLPPGGPRAGETDFHISHYHFGDSPRDASGTFEWTKPGALRDWFAMPPHDSDPGRNTKYVWLTGKIPALPRDAIKPDPYLLFTNAQYEFEVYAGKELIYTHGDFEDGKAPVLTGHPVFVPLGELPPNTPLFLRIQSLRDNVLIGKIGPVHYGSQTELKLKLIRSDAMNAAGVLVFFIIGFVALLMYFVSRDSSATLTFALFALLISVNLLLSLKSPLLFVDYSGLLPYIGEPLGGTMVYVFSLYFIEVLRPAFPGIIRAAGRALLAAGLLMPIGKLLVPGLMETFHQEISMVRNIGFSFLCALCLAIIVFSIRKGLNSDAKWFVAGFSLYLIVNVIGFPLRMYIESRPDSLAMAPLAFAKLLRTGLDYSLLFSTFFFAVISFKRYIEVYRATRSYVRQLSDWNATLEMKVKERTRSIRNLLDHAGQGFLTLDERLIVQEEYSEECRRLFGQEIAYASFVELLYPEDVSGQALYADILHSAFGGDELQREVCLTLLPAEAEVQGRRVALQYRWIPDFESSSGNVMVILSDISEQRRMERQIAQERRVLHMVVWVIRHYRDFKEMIEEYRVFFSEGLDKLLLQELSAMEKWAELSRIVHTFKGNFAQFDFTHTAESLHELETRLDEWKMRLASPYKVEELLQTSLFEDWLRTLHPFEWLEEDLQQLREILGDRFDTAQELVTIEAERLRHLERQVYATLPSPAAQTIVIELQKLRYRPFGELLGMYPEYAGKLAERTGKEIYPVSIVGGDFLVDPEVYTEFARSLVHVFRNMVDHGIETPEDRASVGKDRRGTIRCELTEDEQGFRVRLSNNGKEMNLDEIRKQALCNQLCTAEEWEAMSAYEQRMLIFHEGLTTKRTITRLSGRGMGLFAVHKAVEALSGTVRVESFAGEGTAFLFHLPWIGPGELQVLDAV